MTQTRIRADSDGSVGGRRSATRPATKASGPTAGGAWASLRRAWAALLLHVALRLAGVGVLAVWAHRKGLGLHEVLATRWDSLFYLSIAKDGYTGPMEPACQLGGPTCKLAFFPVYPWLTRGVSAVTGLPVSWAAWAIALLASLIAAWGVFAVAEKLHGTRVAFFAVALYAIVPHALVQSMAYTEPVFVALAAWSLYAVLSRSWLTAGVLAMVAGATRPSGSAVVAAVVLSALWSLFASLRSRGGSATRRPTARLCAAVLLAPLGWTAFFVWVGHRLGRWDGYFIEQRAWGSTFDGGRYTLEQMRRLFTEPDTTLDHVVVALTVAAAVVLLLVLVTQRPPAAVWIYTAVLVLIAVGGAGFFHSKARFLLPAFPLLFPLAAVLARARRTTAVWVLVSASALSALYGGYLVLVWHRSP
ncbi:glycosyltransferase family 39 protein [Streptomyces goshikiensis]|uniref:glycosyltransferase family 39 protein n=1 Tax=Streptomyces goshikiensis TaxID=1942 RepID=UPI0036558BD7